MKFLENFVSIFLKLLFFIFGILVILIIAIISSIFSILLKIRNNRKKYKKDSTYEIVEINTKKNNKKADTIQTINRKLKIKDADLQ